MHISAPLCLDCSTYFVDSKAQRRSGNNHYFDWPTD